MTLPPVGTEAQISLHTNAHLRIVRGNSAVGCQSRSTPSQGRRLRDVSWHGPSQYACVDPSVAQQSADQVVCDAGVELRAKQLGKGPETLGGGRIE